MLTAAIAPTSGAALVDGRVVTQGAHNPSQGGPAQASGSLLGCALCCCCQMVILFGMAAAAASLVFAVRHWPSWHPACHALWRGTAWHPCECVLALVMVVVPPVTARQDHRVHSFGMMVQVLPTARPFAGAADRQGAARHVC